MTKRGRLESRALMAWLVPQNLTRLGSNNVADVVAVEQPIQKDGDGGVGILESDNNNNDNNNNNNNNNDNDNNNNNNDDDVNDLFTCQDI